MFTLIPMLPTRPRGRRRRSRLWRRAYTAITGIRPTSASRAPSIRTGRRSSNPTRPFRSASRIRATANMIYPGTPVSFHGMERGNRWQWIFRPLSKMPMHTVFWPRAHLSGVTLGGSGANESQPSRAQVIYELRWPASRFRGSLDFGQEQRRSQSVQHLCRTKPDWHRHDSASAEQGPRENRSDAVHFQRIHALPR